MITLKIANYPTGFDFPPIEERVGEAARAAGITGARVGIRLEDRRRENLRDILGHAVEDKPDAASPILARVYVEEEE